MNVQGITIDGATSRDLDDAIWLERHPSADGLLLGVMIAAPDRVVRKDSPVDREAFVRAASRYHPWGTTPMLPRRLSEMRLSLLPGQPRRALAILLHISPSFEVLDTSLQPCKLQNVGRLSYGDVPSRLGKLEDHGPMLDRLAALAQGLLARRRARGALALYDLNNHWVATETGHLRQIKAIDATIGYVIVQECMILANAALARLARTQGIPVIFRNHCAKRDPNRDELLELLEQALQVPVAKLDAIRLRTANLLERARYGESPEGHFGLNLDVYLHGTSPLRRFPDLVNQRQFLAFARGEPFPYTAEEIAMIARHVNEVEAATRAAEDERHREAATTRATRYLESAQRIATLGDKDFERVLKVAIRGGSPCPEALVQAATQRLDEDRCPLLCKMLIAVQAPKEPSWIPLRKSVLQSLGLRPGDVMSLFGIATSVAGWPAPVIRVTTSGPSHLPRFVATACLRQHEGPELQGSGEAPTKAGSIQGALCQILAVYAGIDLEDVSSPVTHRPTREEKAETIPMNVEGKDPLMVLHEHGQRAGEAVSFQVDQQGLPHAPRQGSSSTRSAPG